MLGLGGAGLLQVAIYVGLIIVPGATLLAIFQVSLAKLALSLVYFAIAYLLFACLMMWTGMIGRTSQESGQMSALWMLAAASPMFFIASIGAAPNGWLVAHAVVRSPDQPGHDADAHRQLRCARLPILPSRSSLARCRSTAPSAARPAFFAPPL